MQLQPRRALRIFGAMALPVAIALAACQPSGGGGASTASPSEAMMEESTASPSEAMMEESPSPSEAMMEESALPS